MMADLPTFRTTAFEPTFTQTGVDLFGPLNTKRRIVVVKRWGVLLTCLHSLVVLLEVASSSETVGSLTFKGDSSVDEAHTRLSTEITAPILLVQQEKLKRP